MCSQSDLSFFPKRSVPTLLKIKAVPAILLETYLLGFEISGVDIPDRGHMSKRAPRVLSRKAC
jgi:hypothetical protein